MRQPDILGRGERLGPTVLTGPLLPAPRFQGKFLSNAVRGPAPQAASR
jgi:hypothetical protein